MRGFLGICRVFQQDATNWPVTRLGAVDASVIAAAERLGATEVATLVRRHFSVVWPRHEVALALLP